MKALVTLWLCALAACGRAGLAAEEPVWGKQPCESCAMLLSDKANGAQVLTTGDERLFFDDIGCLALWSAQHPSEARGSWVRTADTQAWLPLERARFVAAPHTPMDFGFAATQAPGTVTWPQVVAAVRARQQAN